MSLTKTQIDALIDRNCKTNSTRYSVADKTADENLAIDEAFSIIFEADGRWQFDDSNHNDYPIITTNIVSGQRDYSFTTDENGNLILDIYKVLVADENGVFYELECVDQQSDEYMQGFWDGNNTTGKPSRYDKTANGIFLDAIPNYNESAGLKIFINREGSYFTVNDTTKKPGFAGLYHEYVALVPSIRYCKRNKMFDLANQYERDREKMEKAMKLHYRTRAKDEMPRLTAESICSI